MLAADVHTEPLLKDRVILIVGGTTGLGLSASLACVQAGAKTVLVGRDAQAGKEAVAANGPHARYLAGDASKPDTARAAVQFALSEFGRLDGLYHVAGGSGRSVGDGPVHLLTDDGIKITLDLNLASVMYSNRAVAEHLLAAKTGGSIVNMASVLGFAPSREFFATHAYAAAKAGVVGLTKAAAGYYAPHNIRFNAVAPGLVETPMSQRAVRDERIVAFVKSKQPLDGGRVGQPNDLDGAVVFLLSGASQFVTGQVLAIDGGWCVTDGQCR